MTFLAKRICEAVIVITILMIFIVRSVEQQRMENHLQTRVDRMKVLNQALWDQYGPGSRYAYDRIIQPENYEKFVNHNPQLIHYTDPWQKVFETVDAANAAGVVEGILGVDEAPDWFDECLDEAEKLSNVLEEALQTGPYLAAPDEVFFATDRVIIPNFLRMQNTAKVLRHYAMKQWYKGERKEAVETLHQIMRMTDAFRVDPYLISHLIRAAVNDMGMQGMERLLWLEPALEDLQRMNAVLHSTDINTWKKPDYAERFIWFEGEILSSDSFASLLLLTKTETRDENYASVLEETGVFPRFTLSKTETASLLRKWTTVPAMKKRLQNPPDAFYEGDPLLKPEDAKQLPALWYAAYRYNSNLFGYNELNANTRFDIVRTHMQLLRQAVWARILKEQTGQFPDRERYQSYLNEEMPLEYYNYSYQVNPGQNDDKLIEKFKQIHYSSEHLKNFFHPVKGLDQWDKRKIHYPIDYGFNWYNFDPQRYNYFGNPNSDLKDFKPQRDELVNWTAGIFQAFKPIVKSTTITYSTLRETLQNRMDAGDENINSAFQGGYGMMGYGMMGLGMGMPMQTNEGVTGAVDDLSQLDQPIASYLTVELDLPKETLWFVHQGPNKLFDAGNASYDPSNGITSVGDIYQFVGWK